MFFELDRDTRSELRQALFDLFDAAKRQCQLVYPPIFETCTNCPVPVGGASSIYSGHGGSNPISNRCIYCGGTNKREVSQTETIWAIIDTRPKNYLDLNFAGNTTDTFLRDVRLNDGIIETKCLIGDLPKVKRAIKMRILGNLNNVAHMEYKLFSEPVSQGIFIQDEFITTLWQRI